MNDKKSIESEIIQLTNKGYLRKEISEILGVSI